VVINVAKPLCIKVNQITLKSVAYMVNMTIWLCVLKQGYVINL